MRIGGGSGARKAVAWACHGVIRVAHTPATALAVVVTPIVFAGAVAAAPRPAPVVRPPTHDTNVMPLAAVVNSGDISEPSVIEVSRPPATFHVAAASLSAPPPAVVVNSPGALRIPSIALAAYRNAERLMALAQPNCGISWNLLAGIGRIESLHANNGAMDTRGTAVRPIYGPTLDGSLPGNEIIVASMAPNGQPTYARAMGPMHFLPGTWARFAADAKGDGRADPQNIFDASLSAARYLCSGGLNLRDPSQVLSAILRYNNSMPYAQNVLGWAAAYATGVVPVDLPPITGSPPPLGDVHEQTPEGLGPDLPMNINGVPVTDPFSQIPVIDLGQSQGLGQPPMFPWMAPNTPVPAQTRQPGCTVICIGPQNPPPGGPQVPPPAFPPGVAPPPPPDAVPPGAPQAGPPPVPPAGPPSVASPGPAAGPPNTSPSRKPLGPRPNT